MKNKIFFFLPVLFFSTLLFSCRSMPEDEELALVYYNLGNAYSELGKSSDAGKAYERAFMLKPDLVKAGYNLGRIKIETGEYKEGIGIFEDLLSKDPENIIVKEALAWGYCRKGDDKKAVNLYKEILKTDSLNIDALYNISVLLSREGEYREAYPYLLELDKLDEADAYIYMQTGTAEKQLGLSGGVVWFEKAAEKSPDDEEILTKLAEAYTDKKEYDSAVETYTRILSRKENGDILYKKAFIQLVYIEDYDEGLKTLREAFKAGISEDTDVSELADYPDLLYRDRILDVINDWKNNKGNPLK